MAATDLFNARWTADIRREWVASLLHTEPHRDSAAFKRTCDLLEKQVVDCLVTGLEDTVEAFDLPSPDDRQVLAAAVAGGC